MRPEHWLQDLRWRVGLLVLAVMTGVGGACALWVLQDVRDRSARAAREDAEALAQSVAQTLAQQLGRAARLGIPLAELPAVPTYLQAVLEGQPALVRIRVEAADGRVLHGVQAGGKGAAGRAPDGAVRRSISGMGAPVGAVAVVADPAASVDGLLRGACAQAVALVLGLALVAALASGLGPGARMEEQRRRVRARLAGQAPAQAAPGDGLAAARGLPALALALEQGEARMDAARKALQAYAGELLATDFDGQLRPDIERIVRDSGAELAAEAVMCARGPAPASGD